ncbi:aldose epimerase family protein [Parapedobacter pyrenivorans]|uniref:aldose epimerase family protein n=1 Tax=Parapedobacter pyrenivorans TaxID=1305674 RepID=UPI003342BA34
MKNHTFIFCCVLLSAGCQSNTMQYIKSQPSDFRKDVSGKAVDLYYLKNKNGLEMAVTNFGARVVELWVPDRNGDFADVVLGHNHIDKYVNYQGERFLGATIGRFGNRIANGEFTLGAERYEVVRNEGSNSLHGGLKGFDMVVWDAKQLSENEIEFTYISEDGEEGFPGTLSVTMTYRLSDSNAFEIVHKATTDKQTVLNLTHHSFFNLHGEGNGSINDHVLSINALSYTPVDSVLIPTGELASVENTPMDFREAIAIGSRVNDDFEQLKLGGGYDHNWVLNRATPTEVELAATVYEPVSGRFMEVLTTEPGIQFYGGNFFDGKVTGKSGKPYSYREALALETQHFPDSPNQPGFPSTELKPGEEYRHVCVYKFSVK